MRKTVTELIDDLTGGPADETVEFSFAGTRYEIDLSAAGVAAFRQQLAPWLQAARPVQPARSIRTVADRRRSAQIRAWAIDQGIPLADRGRLSSEVVRRWRARPLG